jgi:hypothetical protein
VYNAISLHLINFGLSERIKIKGMPSRIEAEKTNKQATSKQATELWLGI